jgi:hypothetical protein
MATPKQHKQGRRLHIKPCMEPNQEDFKTQQHKDKTSQETEDNSPG